METIKLIRPRALFENYSATEIQRRDIPRLRDAKVLDWEGKPIPLELVNNAGKACEVHTINEHRNRRAEGYYPATTYAMRLEGGYYDLTRRVLAAAQLAAVAQTSFIDEPFISVGTLNFLPAHITQAFVRFEEGQPTEPELGDRTVAELLAAGECKVEERDPTSVFVEKSIRSFNMEILRADLNGDGIQDMLVHQIFQVVGGTMSWARTIILTRTSKTSLLELVPLSFD